MLETLDAAAVRRWCGGGLEALRAHQREIDDLNVYPVPDGDTGTNLVLTLTAAHEALGQEEAADTAVGRLMRRMARGALLGARGNSGVIVSQILRGMADTFAAAVAVRGGELARALRTATDAAYAAVARPVEGTVLSVVAAAAEGAGRINSDNLVTVARAAARAAAEALERTPQQLPILARAGVVDAGGRGLCLLLDALVDAVADGAPGADGAPQAGRTSTSPADDASGGPATGANETPHAAHRGDGRPEATGHRGPAERLDGPDRGGPEGMQGAGHGGAAGRPEGVGPDGLLGAGPGGAAGRVQGVGPDGLLAGAGPGGAAGRPEGVGPDGLLAGAGHSHAAGRPEGIGHGGAGERASRSDGAGALGAAPAAWPIGHEHQHDGDEDGCSGLGYEVQYLLDATPETVATLRRNLDGLGDSLVVVGTGEGDPPTWNVHVHVTEIGPAIEAGISAGRPYRIRVTPLEERRAGADVRAAVVVAAGEGLTALFEAEGATVVDRNPSTAELLAAIQATRADCVVLLPNDANTHAVASSAAREAAAAGVRVSVVPTRSPVQALAALAVRDRQRPFADDVIAMAEAAGACRYGEVCTAQRDALTVAGQCRAGDLLGLVDGEVHVIGQDLTDVSRRLLDRMLGGGGELVTLVLGADAPADLETVLRGHVHRTWPFIELQCYAGGQPRYHLLAGVE